MNRKKFIKMQHQYFKLKLLLLEEGKKMDDKKVIKPVTEVKNKENNRL